MICGPDDPVFLDDDACEHCGDGDPVLAKGYWRCPVCDAEWNQDDEDEEPSDDR